MRSVPVVTALLVALGNVPAHAQNATTTTTTPAPLTETTEVHGDVPASLVGRWLAVCQAKLPNGQYRPFTRLFEIASEDGKLAFHLKQAELPLAVGKHMEPAIGKSERWTPSPEDLEMTAAQWDQLPPVNADYRTIETKIYAAPAFTPELKNDDITKSSDYAIVLNEGFGGRDRVVRTLTVWGIKELSPDLVKTSFITTTIAAAPLPIPITLRGESELYRVGSGTRPERSLVQRILDNFRGCGKRAE
jgi:hypothetical protein